MSVATLSSPAVGPLSTSQQDEIASAHGRAKKIRKAAGVAAFNGWATAIFAVVSAPFALFSISGFLVAVGLSIVAYNEFRGRKRLLSFDPTATRLLGWNQLGFLGLIVIYCLWMLFVGLTGEGPIAAELRAKPELGAALDGLSEFDLLYRWMIAAVYGTVMLLSIVFQGLNAVYYFTRRKLVEGYVQETPDWIVELQRLTPAS